MSGPKWIDRFGQVEILKVITRRIGVKRQVRTRNSQADISLRPKVRGVRKAPLTPPPPLPPRTSNTYMTPPTVPMTYQPAYPIWCALHCHIVRGTGSMVKRNYLRHRQITCPYAEGMGPCLHRAPCPDPICECARAYQERTVS